MTGPGECGCVPGHRMMILTGTCADCGLTEVDVKEGRLRPCLLASAAVLPLPGPMILFRQSAGQIAEAIATTRIPVAIKDARK